MAMIEGVFVNLGICGSYENAEGIGQVTFSGYRNFGKNKWPQMDIGHIEFYNPRVATDEVARNRRLTRNQAYWLAGKIAVYMNTLVIPNEDEFEEFTENGIIKSVVVEPDGEEEKVTENLGDYLNRSADTAEKEGKPGWAGAMRDAADMRRALHSVESSLTELVRDHPDWARHYDHQALVTARAMLKK